MLNKLLKFPYFLNDIKPVCMIKWGYLIPKLDKIFEIRRQGSKLKQMCFGF